jgi:hypothetical protein
MRIHPVREAQTIDPTSLQKDFVSSFKQVVLIAAAAIATITPIAPASERPVVRHIIVHRAVIVRRPKVRRRVGHYTVNHRIVVRR